MKTKFIDSLVGIYIKILYDRGSIRITEKRVEKVEKKRQRIETQTCSITKFSSELRCV